MTSFFVINKEFFDPRGGPPENALCICRMSTTLLCSGKGLRDSRVEQTTKITRACKLRSESRSVHHISNRAMKLEWRSALKAFSRTFLATSNCVPHHMEHRLILSGADTKDPFFSRKGGNVFLESKHICME